MSADRGSIGGGSGWRWGSSGWRHAPPWKRWCNTALRAVQPQRWKFVIFTRTVPEDETSGHPPEIVSYGVGFVEHY